MREHGKGRVFYTAFGHDARTWNVPGFQSLVERGTVWAVNDATWLLGDGATDAPAAATPSNDLERARARRQATGGAEQELPLGQFRRRPGTVGDEMLAPFRLDLGPRIFRGVSARSHSIGLTQEVA